jgi:UDP-glucose 4-epimerase
MNILVTGGAGYIGSHMARMLVSRGFDVTVLDSMEFGHKAAVPKEANLVVGNTGDRAILDTCFAKSVDAVIHFAAYLSVEESVAEPVKYFYNNVISPVTLLEAMAAHNIRKFIFSSSAAVYGNPTTVPIPETHAKNPESPYGLTKWSFEEMLRVFDKSEQIRSISLRYFNASGASLDGLHGEAHANETHIIPLAIATAMGKRPAFHLFGTDYPTRDGSCERDFIHIEDLCEAHVMALGALSAGHATDVYNVATGRGCTNKELVAQVKKTTGVDFPVVESARRLGDPGVLVADSTKIKKELGWNPKHSDIETIVKSAWNWHSSHPNGYESSQ